MKAVVFDFADSRGGQHVRAFLGLPGPFSARLEGQARHRRLQRLQGLLRAPASPRCGCMAHARRKFHEPVGAPRQSPIGEQALKFFKRLYDIRARSAKT